MSSFAERNFAMCGKTVGSFRRNVVSSLKPMLAGRGYSIEDRRSDNLLIISDGIIQNYFYIFGGRDERSQDLIQGVTLAGVYLDEVALMPQSFVNQATARCSVEGAKMWFNCNPSFPSHWFKTDWIDKAKDKNILYLHFLMDDNLSLSKKTKDRYKHQYTGVFYERYIEGKWTLAEGIIYPMYKKAIAELPDGLPERYVLSIDYGTQNAFAALLWGKYGDVWYAVDEYYYSGRDTGIQKTDEEYARDLDKFTKRVRTSLPTIIDTSAASFITLLRRKKDKYKVKPADNAVMDGIRNTATALDQGYIKISPKCENWAIEAGGYVWDDDPSEDRPVKIADHCLTGDTLVMTENGENPISELVGTTGKVWSYNTFTCEKELKQYKHCRLTKRQSPIWELKTASGKAIKGTIDHLILTKKGWLELGRCMFEDVQIIDGNFEKVVSIHAIGYADVYNMEVEDNHNFAVNGGAIVHNCMDSTRYFVQTMKIGVKKKRRGGASW
jgi:PBSX family phage terminase large subunit